MSGSMYLKWGATDTGARPISPCPPPGGGIYYNESVWLSDPSNGSTLSGATVGQTVNINVKVSSESATFTPDVNAGLLVQVQVWVCDFTLGIGPKGGLNSAGGAAGQTGLVKATLSPASPQTVTVPWTAQQGDLTNVDPNTHNGHLCLGANCFWEGSSPPAEGADLTDPTATLDICNDQHQGQHNIAVIPASPHPIKIKLWNFGNQASRFVVGVAEFRLREPVIHPVPIGHRLPVELGIGTIQHIAAHPGVRFSPRAVQSEIAPFGGRPIADFRNEAGVLALPEPLERAQLISGAQLALASDPERSALHIAPSPAREFSIAGAAGRGQSIEELVEPHQAAEITFAATPNPDDGPGAIHAFDLTQRAANGRVLGGARIVTINGAS